jgi:TonB-linked SusC/RagA family outer membrane protein
MQQHFPEEIKFQPCMSVQGSLKLNHYKSMKKITECSGYTKFPGSKKLFRFMKLTTFLILLSIGTVFASKIYSQTKKLNLKLDKTTVKEVLSEIENQSEFYFMYNSKLIDADREVSVNIKNQKVEEVLISLFKKTDVDYVIKDRFIVLTNKAKDTEFQTALQQRPIKGTVTDNTGSPLPGVSIIIKGTTTGTVTDSDGEYTIENVSSETVLVFSFIGMETQEVTIANQTLINVQLKTNAIGIEEVIAVAYGTVKRENLTGSVEQVSGEMLESRPIKTIGEGLQGVVPGLNITKSSGAPDATESFNIRGYTSMGKKQGPLILVDGVAQDISTVNPEDVESISVLKDAAASAIYGSRAPFGVILVKTKSGKEGTMKIDFSSNLSFSELIGTPQPVNSVKFAESWNDAFRNARQQPYFSEETIKRMRDYADGTITESNIIAPDGMWGKWDLANGNTDWIKEIYKDFQFNQKYTVALSGGLANGKLTYYVSGGFSQNNGMLKMPMTKDSYTRYNTVIKLSSQINKWLKVGINSRYSKSDTERPGIAGGDWAIANSIGRVWPNIPAYNPDGEFHTINKNAQISQAGYYKTEVDDLWQSASVDITPLKGLVIHGTYTYNSYSRGYFKHETNYSIPQPNGTVSVGGYNPSRVEEQYNKDKYRQTEVYASYNYKLKNHNFDVLGGYQDELKNYADLWGYKKDLLTESVPSISTANGTFEIDDNLGHWSTRGWFGRFNYNYKEKYLLEVNGRYDASSRFPTDTRWEFFPSFSAAWNIAKENFWTFEDVSMFKIRGSYGELGNQNVSNYLYLPNMSYSAKTFSMLDGTPASAIYMPKIVSPNITWTKPRLIDIGSSLIAFNNRLDVTYDWFQRTIYDQLGPAEEVSKVLGASPPKENNAVSETRGWDLSIKWRDKLGQVAGKNINYYAKLAVSDYIGYVVDYKNETGGRSGTWTPGERFGDIYGYETVGIAQSAADVQRGVSQHRINSNYWYPGDIIYKDQNGDGKIDSGDGTWYNMGDRVKIGNSSARYTYGITIGGDWNGFDLNMFFQGVGKQDIAMGTCYYWGFVGSMWHSSVFEHTTDYWTPENTGAYYPRPYMSGEIGKNHQTQSKYILNGAYLRFKNLQVGYSIPKSLLSKLSISRLRVYGSIENLGLVFSKSHVKLDPMLLNNDNGQIYPPQRSFSFGLNVTL